MHPVETGLTHIGLPLLQDPFHQFRSQLGSHHTLPVLFHGAVNPGVPFKDCKLAAHMGFQVIQQGVHILLRVPGHLFQFPGQHVGAIGAAHGLHPGNQSIKHIYTDHHCHRDRDSLQDRHNKAYLQADTPVPLFLYAVLRLDFSHLIYSPVC